MRTARAVRDGQALRIDGELYKVVSAAFHSGTAKLSGAVRATLRNLHSGHVTEQRWLPDERLDDVTLERTAMQFLYLDEDDVVFMHPETFDQVSIPRSALEKFLPFLKEGSMVEVETFEGTPVDLDLPKTTPLVVASCGHGIRGRSEHTMKEATMENGMVVLVPQFIEPGDTVVVDIQTGGYLERVRKK